MSSAPAVIEAMKATQDVWRCAELLAEGDGSAAEHRCTDLVAVEVTVYRHDGQVKDVIRVCNAHGRAIALAAAAAGRDVDAREL
ncbi:MAG: hypothetical protein QM804_15670 [Propionicimonas sp.]